MADTPPPDLAGTYILRGGPLDEAQTLLDDHIIKSRAMSASPFAKPIAADILPWVARLTRLNAILEQWLTCQVHHCRLPTPSLYPTSLWAMTVLIKGY